MEGKQKARIEQTIHQMVAGMLIRKIKDPRVSNVSIIRVDVAKDYSLAKIFFNVIGGSRDLPDVERGLRSCSGFIRSSLKKELRLRIIPEIAFIYDSSLDRAMAIEELIDRIHDEEGTPESSGAGEPDEDNDD